MFVDKSLQFLKKKGQNKLLREKLENTNEKVLMRLAGACFRRPVSIDFLAFLVQKYKENIRWNSNTQLRWNFFQESGFKG